MSTLGDILLALLFLVSSFRVLWTSSSHLNDLVKMPRLVCDSGRSCLSLLSARMTGLHHHTLGALTVVGRQFHLRFLEGHNDNSSKGHHGDGHFVLSSVLQGVTLALIRGILLILTGRL